jgi:hypothetical protein
VRNDRSEDKLEHVRINNVVRWVAATNFGNLFIAVVASVAQESAQVPVAERAPDSESRPGLTKWVSSWTDCLPGVGVVVFMEAKNQGGGCPRIRHLSPWQQQPSGNQGKNELNWRGLLASR